MEHVYQRRFRQAPRKTGQGRHANCADKASIAGGDIARKRRHRLLDTFDRRLQGFPQFREPVAGEVARHQLLAEPFFEFGNAALYG